MHLELMRICIKMGEHIQRACTDGELGTGRMEQTHMEEAEFSSQLSAAEAASESGV